MKKLFLLLAIPLFIFFLTACNDNGSKTETNAVDSTKKDTTKMAPPTVDIKAWQINTDTATKMKDHLHGCKKDCTESNIIDSNLTVLSEIKTTYPSATITWVEARYRLADEDRYCNLRHFGSDPNKCKVKNCRTWIVTVQTGGETAIGVVYYDIATICPPPDPPCTVNQK